MREPSRGTSLSHCLIVRLPRKTVESFTTETRRSGRGRDVGNGGLINLLAHPMNSLSPIGGEGWGEGAKARASAGRANPHPPSAARPVPPLPRCGRGLGQFYLRALRASVVERSWVLHRTRPTPIIPWIDGTL